MRRSQRGFTLIELMVALVVSSLLVGMILAIFSRMSLAYRGQQQIAGVQQVLAAARATIELDAKQAGLGMAQGFKFAADGAAPAARSPVSMTDSAIGPDEVRFFYADPTTQAVVTADVGAAWPAVPQVTVDSSTGFAAGDLVVLSKAAVATVSPIIGSDANIATYDACVVLVTAVAPTTLTFSTAAPWGRGNTGHCTTATVRTMVYKFVARGYRIDRSTPARAAVGPLQQSVTGGLLDPNDVWTDLAYGFTDLQTALRVFALAGADDDGDGDANRNWYSGALQQAKTAALPPAPPLGPTPIQISISLVARTDRDIEGIATAATPQLIDPARPNNNTIGNHPSVALPDPVDDALKGSKIYRHTTFQVDLRNMGVGR